MRAAVLYGVNDLRVEQVPRAQITRPDQALVKIGSVGICGSDVHYFSRGRIGDYVVTQPMILGHEAAGEVVEVGAEVSHLQIGDRVAIEPGYPDGTCAFCREGRYNLCPNVIFLATPPHDGAFADYLTWPAEYLYKLPDSLSFDEGAMLEPLSVGLFAVWSAGVRPGDSVAIFGAGPIGLTTLQCAIAAGAAAAIVVDAVASRLDIACQMGATATLGVSAENMSQIMDLTGGGGVQVAFECAGAVPAMQVAIRVTRSGGVVQLVGMPAEQEPTVPLYDIIGRELRVQGLFRYANTYPAAIALTAEGKVNLGSLVTKSFSLDEVPQAFPWVREHREEVIKAVVRP